MALPRDFVLSCNAAYARNQGIYTVIHTTSYGMLDLPFHLQRMHTALLSMGSNLNLETTASTILRSIGTTLHSHQKEEGYITMCSGLVIPPYLDISASFYSCKRKPLSADCMVDCVLMQRYPIERKYTNWVIERIPVEESRSSLTAETLLLTIRNDAMDKLVVTEGLLSNVFIVQKGPVLVIPRCEDALAGSMQRVVCSLAAEMRVPVRHDDIFLNNYKQWEGMFLTSAVKRMQPVHSIQLPTPESTAAVEMYRFPIVPTVVQQLMQRVEHLFDSPTGMQARILEQRWGYSPWRRWHGGDGDGDDLGKRVQELCQHVAMLQAIATTV